MSIAVTLAAAHELDSLTAPLGAVYRSVFALPPYGEPEALLSRFGTVFGQHRARGGFACCVARDAERRAIVGFAYGYTSRPGQWWADQVTRGLAPDLVERWFRDCFELVDLAVLPEYQGQGAGSRLHDTLLAAVPHATAALSTLAEPTPALQLYRTRAWQTVVERLVFDGVARPFTVLGRALRSAPDGRA